MLTFRILDRLLRGLMALACLAAFGAATQAAEVLISGFEMDLSSSIPGATWAPGADLTTQIVSGIPGTSEGSSVLQIEHPEYWTGDQGIVLDGSAVAEAISQSTALKFDLIAPQDFSYRQVFVVVQGSPVGWNSTQTQIDLMAGPDTAYTAEFDLTAEFEDVNGQFRPLNEIALDAFDEETDWFQLVIVFQGPDNLPLGTSITYLDNVRLVQPDTVGIDGDYNADGSVDAADYASWRKNVGAAAGALPNDPTGEQIGPAQHDLWMTNFGNGGGGGAAGVVPEPNAFALGLLTVALVWLNVRVSSKSK